MPGRLSTLFHGHKRIGSGSATISKSGTIDIGFGATSHSLAHARPFRPAESLTLNS